MPAATKLAQFESKKKITAQRRHKLCDFQIRSTLVHWFIIKLLSRRFSTFRVPGIRFCSTLDFEYRIDSTVGRALKTRWIF